MSRDQKSVTQCYLEVNSVNSGRQKTENYGTKHIVFKQFYVVLLTIEGSLRWHVDIVSLWLPPPVLK